MEKILLFILTVPLLLLLTTGCTKDEENLLTNEIDQLEEGIQKKGLETIDEEGIFKLTQEMDELYKKLNSQITVSTRSTHPHWVGVIPNSGKCPIGVNEIRYHEDLENNDPCTRYMYNNAGCFKSEGLKVVGGDIDWVVCIVDGNQYKFNKIAKGYAIFDLSLPQYYDNYNNSTSVYIYLDDEDSRNKNMFHNPSYGFFRNTAPGGLPLQVNQPNTEFWFCYFTGGNYNARLPELGFEYSVFGNFDCCSWVNQNEIIADQEDSNNRSFIKVHNQGTNSYTLSHNQVVDNESFILRYLGNIMYYIQNAAPYK